jgi:hypothetical protein
MALSIEELRAEAQDAVEQGENEYQWHERWRVEHPGWCETCYGEGWLCDDTVGIRYECPKCLALFKCPRCGTPLVWSAILDWYFPCAKCGHNCQ